MINKVELLSIWRHLSVYSLDFKFVCLLPFQGPAGDKTVEMAIADPDRFVLKPQLEGGGI